MARTSTMGQPLPFDPEFYFGMVAENLLRSFGDRALYYADEALMKMRQIGDTDGFDMWLAIHAHLNEIAADALPKDQMTAGKLVH